MGFNNLPIGEGFSGDSRSARRAFSRLERRVLQVEQQLANLEVRRAVTTGAIVKQFKIKSIDGDFLVCNSWDGTNQGTDDINIAKPYLERRTPFDGETRGSFDYTYSDDVTRESDDSSTTEDQTITPDYIVGDVVYAVRGVEGGTDVEDDDGNAVVWLLLHSERSFSEDGS